jgi:hypothetical protein
MILETQKEREVPMAGKIAEDVGTSEEGVHTSSRCSIPSAVCTLQELQYLQ